ncbi:NAD(P)H-binding protein [Lentzea flava]|uniref:NAD(P)H-binding protein n=1 Tax=Lentzea flava TaxID=103732 RepID=UPI001E654414|nr:hypothetical protein [Lentzea flava]
MLVLGATGGTGRMAVQVARRLGAHQVVAVGCDPERLAALPGLTATALTGDAETIARVDAEIDIVLDFLWAAPAAEAMAAMVSNRADPTRPLTWVNLGETASPERRCRPARYARQGFTS